MKVSIVGAGIVGLSLARELIRRKVEVSVFELGAIPNPLSSSMDEHRITRHTYAGLPGYADLMPAAFRSYESIWADIGRTHYLPTDVIYLTRGGVDRYEETAADLDPLGIPHRRLSHADLRREIPHIRLDGVESAFRAGGAGILFAERIMRDLALWLEQAGAKLYPHCQVQSIDPERGTLIAEDVEHGADLVVVTAGAWIGELLPQFLNRTIASRQMMLYLRAPEQYAAAWANSPVLVDNGPNHGAYILPPRDGTRLKIGDHRFSLIGTGSDTRSATEADLAPVLEAARTALNQFEAYASIERKICFYTVTADERFVVEPIGAAGWVGSACSGHGFKLGALNGRILAMGITGEITAAEAAALAAGRGDPRLLDE